MSAVRICLCGLRKSIACSVILFSAISLAGCGFFGQGEPPTPTQMPLPSPTSTSTPFIEPTILVNLQSSGPEVDFTGSPEEILLDNCGGLRDSTLTQTVMRSFIAEVQFEVSDQIAGEFGVGVKIVEAKIRNEISAKLGVRFGTQLTRSSEVEAVVPAGHRTITTLQFKESWKTGDVELLRPDGTYIDVLPFVALDSLKFVQTGVQTIRCDDGQEVVAEDTTPVAIPPAEILLEAPTLKPTAVPIVTGKIVVPGNLAEGISFPVTRAGTYIFRYVGGAYSTYPPDRIPSGLQTWLADVRVFKNRPVQFDDDKINEYSDYRLVNLGYGNSTEEVQNRALQNAVPVQIQLVEGDELHIVAVDARSAYNDNPGQVEFEVLFIAN